MTALEHVVIAGASVAGLAAADALRDGGFTGTITVLSEERVPPYDRPPLTKELLSSEEELAAVPLRDEHHFEARAIDLLLGHMAVGLDPDRRLLVTSDGDALPWDAVVIATGARARELRTTDGDLLPTLRTVHDLADVRALAGQEVLVIGSSFIGLEVAAGLHARGSQVRVVGAEPEPLVPAVGPGVAAAIRRLHEDRGVTLHTGTEVVAVHGRPGDLRVELRDGRELRAPHVVAGIGVVPNVEWLVGSGVELDRGVVTDAHGRTTLPGVWAAGDVATTDHPLAGPRAHVDHWTNAAQQARTVAVNILADADGRDLLVHDAVPYFWTDQYDRKIQVYGTRRPDDVEHVAAGSLDGPDHLVLYGSPDGDRFSAVVSNGHDRLLRPYRKLLKERGGWSAALAVAAEQAVST